jgi:hypothetical protein
MTKRALVLLVALAGPAVAQESQTPPAPPGQADARTDETAPTIDTFKQGLSPYGSWQWSKDYGWTWRPRVADDWRPYWRGQWDWTDAGWTWASDEPWGWATYHYGRWAWDGAGWFWVPGFVWGPAWVDWWYGPGFIGWAPLWPFQVALTFDFFTFVPVNRFHGFPIHRLRPFRPPFPPSRGVFTGGARGFTPARPIAPSRPMPSVGTPSRPMPSMGGAPGGSMGGRGLAPHGGGAGMRPPAMGHRR